jgi:hypothetical protein
MSEEQRREQAEGEAKQQAESKSDEQREREEEWSQGGQDVEEAQHDVSSEDRR